MATINKSEKIIIGIDNETIELIGADKEAFLADREERNVQSKLVEAEYKAKLDSRESAIKKLAEIAGLTKDELNAIL
jgi:hypothetical protein